MPTLLLGPKLVQPELDDMAGHVDLNFHGKLKDWEEGPPRLLCPITAAGQSHGPLTCAATLPQRFRAGGLEVHASCLI